MMDAVKGRRTYHSPQRDGAAAATRLAVLTAAHTLFVDRGYAATTVDQIAERAEVSRPTVFAVGSKADLLRLVRDIALAGDDRPEAVASRRPHQEAMRQPDPVRTLHLHARNVVAIAKRYADVDEVLRQAAGGEPALRELWETSEEQRRTGARLVVDNVRKKSPLRPGLSRSAAVDVLWLLMAPDHYRRLTGSGWSAQRYERWLGSTMCEQLLGSDVSA